MMPGIHDKEHMKPSKLDDKRKKHIDSIKDQLEGGIEMAYAIMAETFNQLSEGKRIVQPEIVFMSGYTKNPIMIDHLYQFWGRLHEEIYFNPLLFKGQNIGETGGRYIKKPFTLPGIIPFVLGAWDSYESRFKAIQKS